MARCCLDGKIPERPAVIRQPHIGPVPGDHRPQAPCSSMKSTWALKELPYPPFEVYAYVYLHTIGLYGALGWVSYLNPATGSGSVSLKDLGTAEKPQARTRNRGFGFQTHIPSWTRARLLSNPWQKVLTVWAKWSQNKNPEAKQVSKYAAGQPREARDVDWGMFG